MTATRHPDIPREQQTEEAIAFLEKAREQGWAKVSFRITRGGTVDVSVEAADGDKVAGPQFRRRAG